MEGEPGRPQRARWLLEGLAPRANVLDYPDDASHERQVSNHMCAHTKPIIKQLNIRS